MIRSRPFLQSIVFRHEFDPATGVRHPVERVGAGYVRRDDRLRAEHHRPGAAEAWPVRLTRCGQPPGRYGDVDHRCTLPHTARRLVGEETRCETCPRRWVQVETGGRREWRPVVPVEVAA